MVLVKKIAYNFLASSAGRMIGWLFSLASIAFITRALLTEGYGQYSTIMAFLFLFIGIADFGLYSLMLREISRPSADEKYIVSNFFTLRLISSIFFLSIAVISVFYFPYSFEIKLGVCFSVLGFLFMSLSQILMPIFQKYLSTERAATAEVSGRAVQFFLVFLFFKLKLGLFWFLLALVFGCGVTFFLNLLFSRKHVLFSLNFNWQYLKKILKLTYPIALSIIFTMIYFRGNTILLSLFQAQKDVGIFNLGYKVLENLIFFPAVFLGLIMPILSFNAVRDVGVLKKTMQKSFDVLAMGAVPLALAGFFLSPIIVKVFGGDDFAPAVLPLRILLFAAALIFFGNLGGNSLIALNRQKELAWVYFFGAIFSVGINLYLIPKYSYNGAALSTFLTEFLVTTLMFLAIFKKIHWFPSFELFSRILLASVIMCIPLSFFYRFSNIFPSLILFTLSVFLYFFTLYLIKGITKEDIRTLVLMKK